MGGKSVAARSAAYRQRTNHVKRPEPYKKDEAGNFIDKKVETREFQCVNCGHKAWWKFVRCPDCQAMQ